MCGGRVRFRRESKPVREARKALRDPRVGVCEVCTRRQTHSEIRAARNIDAVRRAPRKQAGA